ncbi:LysR family transcriptional regulator [Advenella mimigardefordensis]|uniref:Transcriptional regulator, LysR family n=1 Tax=Advenella mimigardefordensis (strain DSM 17166 / LMG 22922 / DPN7) TaxID=1247726 RepID=W0PEV1_ADVMD|nr:LysR family transcriptional regulator [Advenella mimigardefordensis]AHG63795.1 transcriptional regulator, LysR family [Advenella mimigardefordensis DPN7]
MDRLRAMAIFVAVAQAESFSSAARHLGMSAPAVTRAISELEAYLGVRLLTRTTRIVRATEAGLRYLDDARRVIAEADEADTAVSGIRTEPRGRLAITAPVLFGRMFVTPITVQYLRRYPEVNITSLFVDRVVNLIEEGLDAGLRIGHLPDSSMKAIRVGQVRTVVCAAPAYLATYGTPETPEQLHAHTIITTSGISPVPEWRFVQNDKTTAIRMTPRLTVTTNDAAIEAASEGFGITRLLSYQIAPFLARGELQVILQDYEPAPSPIHVVHHENRQAAAKVRSFVDMAVTCLRANAALAYKP